VRALHYAFTDRLDDAAEDLDRAAAVRALDALTRHHRRKQSDGASRPKGTAMAGRTAAYGRALFAWAVKRGALNVNPFAALPVAKSVAKRERVLSDQELAEVWRAAGDAAAPYGSILRLLILTGQRRGEVTGMTWNEISEDLMTWTLPGERTKNGVAHTVPLSGPARDLLRATAPARHRIGELVLPSALGTQFAGWSKAKHALDRAIQNGHAKAAEAGAQTAAFTPWNVHDLRRTVATGLQRLGVRLEVTEAVLNHISGSRGGIAGVYQRHDWAAEKRAALDAWAAQVVSVVKSRTIGDNVVTLARVS
jgi:integrase